MSKKFNLYQILKQTGQFKDRAAISKLVSAGRVTVDGVKTTSMQFQCNPKKKKVCVDGVRVAFVVKKVFVINKPQGYSCQKNDKFPYVGKLIDCAEGLKNSLFSVGRLDIPTTGILIITNDGDLSTTLLNPRNKVPKTYKVLCKHKVTDEMICSLEKGVVIRVSGEDYKTKPAVAVKKENNLLHLVIREGKYRQVRKMLAAVGNKVVALERIAIGGLKVRLDTGSFRELSSREVEKMLEKDV